MACYRGAVHAVNARLRRRTGTLPSPPTIVIADSTPPRAPTLLHEASCGSLPPRPAAATAELVHVEVAVKALQGASDWTEKAVHAGVDMTAQASTPKKAPQTGGPLDAIFLGKICPRASRL